ncbi:MAG: hypothetical protein C4520_21630 [Candidatus Abyssobacteria bacterium SURF_5]|uniref:Uncharacterized protein n=1 Tax=Abyssobacteria bacterium (strain SURF_5) TaxID=2093360 RepID=A0A3A4MVW4_ABYX5|nr:MAG: hypothetical protein C4520_21630 [Candidatus Abyssubacteria bacterium SURF_5]
MAVCWLFPGKIINIDSPCLDCGEPIHVEVKDGQILKKQPEEIIGHVSVPFFSWMQDPGFA